MQNSEWANTGVTYFSAKEKKHLEEFAAIVRDGSHIYVNAKGEARLMGRRFWPFGWINDQTQYVPGYTADGQRLYKTPTATNTDTREVIVQYRDMATKEYGACSSSEFLKWLGEDYKVEPFDGSRPNPAMDAYVQNAKKTIADQIAAKKTSEEYDAETSTDAEKPNWKRVSGRKK